jgi:hypothetical protein
MSGRPDLSNPPEARAIRTGSNLSRARWSQHSTFASSGSCRSPASPMGPAAGRRSRGVPPPFLSNPGGARRPRSPVQASSRRIVASSLRDRPSSKQPHKVPPERVRQRPVQDTDQLGTHAAKRFYFPRGRAASSVLKIIRCGSESSRVLHFSPASSGPPTAASFWISRPGGGQLTS